MTPLSHKSKQYGLIALKVLILSLTFGYILLKLTGEDAISFNQFWQTLRSKDPSLIAVFILLAAANWGFEILKWKAVISPIEQLSFVEASKQSLASLTVSLATPNRIGEYGAKAYFFEKEKRKQVLLLNFFSNLMQMGITLIFGFIGLFYVITNLNLSLSVWKVVVLVTGLILFGILGYVFKEKQLLLKGLTIAKVGAYFKKISISIKLKVATYSMIRYLLFSSLFFLLLKFYGAEISVWAGAPIIFAMYLLASVVPTIFVFDVVIKGGIAVWLFTLAGIPEWPVLCTVFSMWLLNFVAPALWGSFYVATYNPRK